MPLRRTATLEGLSARWEVRCLDGFGNMYLCLCVILRAGLQGMREGTKMELGDCQGVYRRVPGSKDVADLTVWQTTPRDLAMLD